MIALSLLLALSACNPLDGEDRYALTGPEANRLVSSVEIEPSGAILEPDGMGQFAAVVKSARGLTVSRNVAWAVADEDVILIDGSGNVVGLNEGTTTLKATHQGVTGDVTVDVRGDVVSLRLNRESVEVAEGEATQLTATFVYANGAEREVAAPLEWRSADPTILGMDSDGLTWGVGSGQTRIHVRGRGHEVVADGRVLPTTVRRVEVGAPTETLEVGEEARFWADVLDDHGNRVFRLIQWSSSDNSVATVSTHGVVKALAEGKATIRAATETVTGSLAIEVVAVGSQAGGGSDGSARETRPGTVTNLSVVSTTRNGATLRLTEVDDGQSRPAKYDIRYAKAPMGYSWGSATSVRKGSCTVPVQGTGIGNSLTCTMEGLQAGTKYDFQLVPYRGTLNQDAVFGPLSDIATGTTQEAPLKVEVLPSGATLEVDQKRQLEASVTDAYGNPVARSVSWSSTRTSVATVSGTGTNNRYGEVTARNVGDTDIRATTDGATGVSKIRVIASEPVGGGGGARPNEPSGLTRIVHHDFSCLPGDGCAIAGDWSRRTSSDSRMSIVSDASAPESPDRVFRGQFPSNFEAGRAPFRWDGWGPAQNVSAAYEYDELYVHFWMKIEGSDFQNQAVGTKIFYVASGSINSHNEVFPILRGNGQTSIMSSMTIAVHATIKLDDGRWSQAPHWPNKNAALFQPANGWHRMELYMKMNDVGQKNGILRFWLNGRLTHDYRDVRYRDAARPHGFYHMQFTPVWGGVGGTRTRDDYWRIDDFYIAGRAR